MYAQLITLITVGVQDPELQKKLLGIRPAPSLNDVLAVYCAFESACADQKKTAANARYVGTTTTKPKQQDNPLQTDWFT